MKKGISISSLVYLALVGVLLVSPFSNMLFDVGGSYIAEVPILILYGMGYLFFGKEMSRVNAVIRSRRFVMAMLLVGIYDLIGMLHGASLAQCYGDARALVVMSFVVLALYSGALLLDDLIVVGVASLCLNVIYSLFFASQDQLKMHYPMLFVVALFVYYTYTRSFSWMCLLGGSSVYFAITSFYRSYWVVAVLILTVLICVILFRFRMYLKKKADLIAIAFLIVGLVYIVGTGLVVRFLESNESRYIQSIAKTEEFIKGVITKNDSIVPESDRERNSIYSKIYNNLGEFILPKGLGHKKYLDGYTHGGFRTTLSTIDGIIYFVVFHFGLLSVLVLILCSVVRIRSVNIWQCLLLVVALPYLLTTAQYFVDIQKAISFGMWIYMLVGFRYGQTICCRRSLKN